MKDTYGYIIVKYNMFKDQYNDYIKTNPLFLSTIINIQSLNHVDMLIITYVSYGRVRSHGTKNGFEYINPIFKSKYRVLDYDTVIYNSQEEALIAAKMELL